MHLSVNRGVSGLYPYSLISYTNHVFPLDRSFNTPHTTERIKVLNCKGPWELAQCLYIEHPWILFITNYKLSETHRPRYVRLELRNRNDVLCLSLDSVVVDNTTQPQLSVLAWLI